MLFELAFNNRSAVTHHKVHLLKFPLRSSTFERTDDAFVLLISFCVLYARCLLITESPKTLGHYRYLKGVLGYIPYMGLAVFSLRFLVFLCILRFRIFLVHILNA